MRCGIAVDFIGKSQLSIELTREINNVGKLEDYHDVVVFYERHNSPITPTMFAMLQMEQMWGFHSPVIATNLNTANKLVNAPSPKRKLFYVYDLEWTYKNYDVDYLINIYCNKDIDLIARSESHHKILTGCWKKPIATIEEFNMKDIIEIIKENNGN